VNTTSLRRAVLPAAAVLTVGLTLTACGDKTDSGSGSGGGSTLNGGGATSQTNAQTTWRADYQKANGGTINYEEVGSGTGVENFTSKAYSFAGTDAYLDSDQMSAAAKACGSDVVEVPAYVSPIAVAFNLSGVKTLNLDAKTISDIFDGKITTWNDPAIAAQNSGVKLPSTAIATIHRSDESGTTKNFTDYLSKAGDGAWSADPDTVWPTSAKGGQGFEGTSGVIGALTDTEGAIGYADDSAVKADGTLGVVSIKVGSSYEAPTAQGAAQVLAASPPAPDQPATSMATDIDRTATAKGDYPLMLVSYLIGCETYSDASTADMVKGYLTYIVSSQGQQAAADAAGSAPLDSSLSKKATSIVSKISSGS
jgi:phosphate transport system substrate-binding protein